VTARPPAAEQAVTRATFRRSSTAWPHPSNSASTCWSTLVRPRRRTTRRGSRSHRVLGGTVADGDADGSDRCRDDSVTSLAPALREPSAQNKAVRVLMMRGDEQESHEQAMTGSFRLLRPMRSGTRARTSRKDARGVWQQDTCNSVAVPNVGIGIGRRRGGTAPAPVSDPRSRVTGQTVRADRGRTLAGSLRLCAAQKSNGRPPRRPAVPRVVGGDSVAPARKPRRCSLSAG
jgi:hypothetical protein